MKATWNSTTIAEAPKEELIRIEGNWYFPPAAIKREYFQSSEHVTAYSWKGEVRYYNVAVDGEINSYGAWYYPEPMDGSVERVKNDSTNYVAFWNGINVQE